MKTWTIPSSSFCFSLFSFLPLNGCFSLLFTCVVCRETVIWQSRWTTPKPDTKRPKSSSFTNNENKYKRKTKTKNENQNQNKQNIINDNFWSFAHLELAPNVYSIFFLFINFPFHSSCLRAISLYATKRERIKRSKGSRNDLMDRFLTVGRADIRHVYILNLERYRYRSEPTASPEAKSKSSRKPFSNS